MGYIPILPNPPKKSKKKKRQTISVYLKTPLFYDPPGQLRRWKMPPKPTFESSLHLFCVTQKRQISDFAESTARSLKRSAGEAYSLFASSTSKRAISPIARTLPSFLFPWTLAGAWFLPPSQEQSQTGCSAFDLPLSR